MSDDRAKHCFEAIQEIFEGIQFFFFLYFIVAHFMVYALQL